MLAVDGPVIGPAASVENNLVTDFHDLLEDLGHQLGEPANSAVHALTSFGESVGFGNVGTGSDDLLTSVLSAPGRVLDGDAGGALCDIVSQAGNALGNAGNFVDNVLDAVNLQNPLGTGLLHDIAGDLGSGPLLSTNLLGGGLSGGLIQGMVNSGLSQPGALINLDIAGDGHPTSSNHLIDIDLGPSGNNGIGVLDILAKPGSGPSHTIEVNAIDTGQNGPHLLDADLFTNPSALNGVGVPSLGSPGGLCDIGDVGGIVSGIVSADALHTASAGHGFLM